MAPSKQWMELVDNRLDEVYLVGVQKFLDYAFQRTGEEQEILCPCVKCFNTILGNHKLVETHFLVYGIIRNYTFWYHHGERLGELLTEYESEDEDGDGVEECESEDEVEELLRDLYPNLDGGSTHTDCDDLLEEPNVEAKKFFYSLLKNFEKSLYENSKASKLSSLIKLLHIKKVVYIYKDIYSWHKDEKVDDGIMRHPTDSMACKSFDELHPSFAVDPRNVRLGLASDGFQPFRNSKTSHSIWHVVLIPYNLPHWLCMKQENFILSMLIPGPNGPGDAIDTYLQPLIEELKELWDAGAKTPYELETDELEQAHIYILKNYDEVLAYLEEFAQTHKNARHLSNAEWNKQFIEWFKDRVAQMHKGDDSRMMEDLLSLSRGPTKYSTHSNDSENLDYYGVLTDVIELQFVMDRRVVLFRCNWFDVFDEIKGIKKDEYDFVSVNPARLLKTNEPFVLANQASQVFYANDNSNKGWQVAMKTQSRDSFEIVEQIDDDIIELGSPSKKKRKQTNEGRRQGQGQGLKSLGEKGSMPTKKLFSQSNDLVNHYIQEIETRKTRGQGPKISTMSARLGMETMHKNALTLEKENMKINIPSPACPGVVGKGLEKRSETAMSSQSTRSNSTMSSSQEM
ncbi:hypothetical protein MTR67_002395 [Solanum verrucosum]|uniref:Transposase-associated domain-containing protein n=1 Tax=Solanum verrucosum TaxID=315347 RepID=A0AAF0TD96_SOLVR|nr:hypothetical protein MTR67_002395 [Solanum verrucosum]